MAKFVIAGKSNCPYFAKAELLGDQLLRNLSDFKIHKIVKEPAEWDSWVSEMCEKNSWKKHTKSPIVWRELVNRGGKGMYLGDHNDFQEYARDYYGSLSELNSDDLRKISGENEKTHVIVEQEKKDIQASIKPFNVTITNPDSPVVYYLLDEICKGSIFGRENEISIKFYTKYKSEVQLGLQMETEDLASDKLRYIKVVDDVREAFTDCDFAILIDELGPGGENPYIELAKAIDEYAKTTCKILITPIDSRAETYALVNVFSQHLKRIDAKTNLIGNSLNDEMELKAILAHRLKVSPAYVKNVFIIGQSTSDSFYVDLLHGQVTDYDGAVWARVNTHWLNLVSMVADKDWIRKELMNLVYERSNLIAQKTNRKRNMMFAQSIKKLCNLWSEGNGIYEDNFYHSAIVHAKDRYSIKDDVYISLPVEFVNGTFNYVPSYQVSLDNQSVLEEIVRDTLKRISANYNGNSYENRSQELKLSIPHVIYE